MLLVTLATYKDVELVVPHVMSFSMFDLPDYGAVLHPHFSFLNIFGVSRFREKFRTNSIFAKYAKNAFHQRWNNLSGFVREGYRKYVGRGDGDFAANLLIKMWNPQHCGKQGGH